MMRMRLQLSVPGYGKRGDEVTVPDKLGHAWLSQSTAAVLSYDATEATPAVEVEEVKPKDGFRHRREKRRTTSREDPTDDHADQGTDLSL
jgi:hypothetical protein